MLLFAVPLIRFKLRAHLWLLKLKSATALERCKMFGGN